MVIDGNLNTLSISINVN